MDDVETWLRVSYQNRHFRLVVASPSSMDAVQRRRAEVTLALFKWNENPDVFRPRKEAILKVLQAADGADQGNLSKLEEVKRLASRFQPFGVAIQQILGERRPDLLPTPTEELYFLVEDLATELLETKGSEGKLTQRYEARILWALAVLWKDPPHVSPGEIERWLERLGCRDRVSVLLAEL